ncbi:hypothetical protein, conserved [Babesia bigemina]|uniref:C3H1-type domain-containing protein n=1 Tax=Babesia bigemina TaxID=5866 RepID=A0A061BLX2_BABBI|nr:hypothetical protein, conserved [Babesia bigemina]CDR71871.1 hypothetical protein, conserved [Babesia bigemina]|eukprot:XP_012770814.1 hypothetical protein, conserved [Babesia bigemina]
MPNEPKKLLENLCDGLQTFLGFDSASKGYDGSGIVYSDLDRLCDGVMGFLYQVLKDVSEKQPYESGKRMFLDRLIREIYAKLCSGVEGFKSVVDRVISRVKQYNEKVVDSNDKVSEPINELLGKVRDEYTKSITSIPDKTDLKIMTPEEIGKIVSPVDKLRDACISSAKSFDTKLTKLTKHINDLNYKLRDSVKTTRERIQLETARVEAMSKKERENYDAVIKLLEDSAENLKKVVNQKVKNDVSSLVAELKRRVSEILKKLETIFSSLQQYVSKLQEWIKKADADVKSAHAQVESILREVNENPMSANRQNVEAAALQLKGKAEELLAAGQKAKENVAETVKLALADVKKMDEALKGDLYKVKDAVQEKVKGIKEAINDVTEELKKHFPTEADNKVTLETTKTFNEYNTYVDQQHLTALSDPDFDAIKAAGTLPAAIGAIKTKVEEALSKIDEMSSQADTHFNEVTTRLHDLCEAIKVPAYNANTTLKVLKDTHFADYVKGSKRADDSIKKIAHELNELKSNLDTGAITDARRLLGDIPKLEDELVKRVTQFVTCEVNVVKKELASRIVQSHVTVVKLLLQQFVAKLQSELEKLPDAIENDKHIGFKGFMEKLYNSFNENIVPKKETKSVRDLSFAFNNFFTAINHYLQQEITRRNDEENRKKNPSLPKTPDPYASKLTAVYTALGNVLKHITDKNYYDYKIPGLLDELMNAVNGLTPQDFADPNTAILDGIRVGLRGFVNEMRKAYISSYDCAKGITWDGTFTDKAPEESRNGVKVFLTIQKMLSDDLTELYTQLTEKTVLRGLKIYASSDDKENTLGDLLQKCGYKLGSENGRQDGEVQCSAKMMGRNILGHLTQNIQNAHYNEHLKQCRPNRKRYNFGLIDIIACIFQHVNQYYTVCHLPTVQSSKLPCNIYQMLSWLCGLTYNPVYPQLSLNAFSDFFEKPEHSAPADSEDVSFDDDTADALPAYPHEVSVANLSTTLMEVCHHSYEVLCAILGHGHAGGRYACDFNTNPDKLSYPSNPSKCLDLCIEILIRLYNQLYFIYVQCHRASNAVSWRDCYYGRHVGGSSWECNEIQCADLIANQRGAQKCNQNADQTCEQHPKCGIKSPLQSFLEDGLPGFLPHPFKTPNCKLTCEAPNHRGIPCKTPMGFADISVTASHTKKGSHLADALAAFCGTPNTPLAAICASLTCLLQRAPRTLDDMFSFYYHLLKGWNGNNSKRNMHKSNAFNDAVSKAHFGEAYPDLDITTIFKGSDHKTGNHVNGELHSLFTCDYGNKTEMECGRYMQPFGHNIWTVFSEVNADKYLTWIVYLTEAFYDLLKKLYEECCKNCKTPGSRCHGKTCHQNCLVSHTSTHSKNCRSIAQCPFTRPTLCKYGFVFQSESNLSGTYGPETKRTCQDFCNALNKVLKKGNVLGDLTYITIPNFLWKIREKFFWLNVALWLLSLLYLIHIMVIRLDLLHIKSHLNSPSSHRIAAQSLLAAARVNKLNRVFYLQP